MSIVLDGTTGLAGAATGALNGTLGATTPSTVVATTISCPIVGGNVQSSTVTGNVTGSTVAETYTDTGASLTLVAGTYLILSNAVLVLENQSGTNIQYRYAVLALRDSSNNIVKSIVAGGGSYAYSQHACCLTCVLTVASTTTYKTSFTSQNNSGSPSLGGLILGQTAYNYNYHNLIAQRLT